jgi:integrase
MLGLRWQDVDFESDIIRIRQSLRYLNSKPCIGPLKTKSSRRDLPMLPAVKDALLRHLEASETYSDDLVFRSSTGNPAYPNTIRKTFQRLAVRAGLPPITLHEARHTAATLLAEAWASPKEAQTILGHSSITTTLQIYTHSRLQREADALGALMRGIV